MERNSNGSYRAGHGAELEGSQLSPADVSVLRAGEHVCAGKLLKQVAADENGHRRLELEAIVDARWIPNSEYQFGLLVLDLPEEAAGDAPHVSMNPYYRRPAGWVEAALADHTNGRCGWTRRRL